MSTEASLVRLELVWKCKKGDIAPATNSVGMTLRNLDEAGYIIGHGSTNSVAAAYVHPDHAKNTISLHAWFIGAGAWKAALEEHEADGANVFSIYDFCLTTTIPTAVIDHTKGSHRPYPQCKKALSSKPLLRFCATEGSRCPPLLAAEGGVVAQWKLPTSYKTRERLYRWNDRARHVAALMGELGETEPFRAWAKREISSSTSILGKEARALAAVVTAETGVRVDPKGPYFSMMAP